MCEIGEITIGVDCDSKAHGVAVYQGHKLVELSCLTTPEVVERFAQDEGVYFAIEDTTANKMVYARNEHVSKSAQSNIAMKVGQNQQACIELVRWLAYYGAAYRLIPPTSGNWASVKMKTQFERITGWKGSSNKDTRSAAFFGFLALGDKR